MGIGGCGLLEIQSIGEKNRSQAVLINSSVIGSNLVIKLEQNAVWQLCTFFLTLALFSLFPGFLSVEDAMYDLSMMKCCCSLFVCRNPYSHSNEEDRGTYQ